MLLIISYVKVLMRFILKRGFCCLKKYEKSLHQIICMNSPTQDSMILMLLAPGCSVSEFIDLLAQTTVYSRYTRPK